jgi:hypothetical protein
LHGPYKCSIIVKLYAQCSVFCVVQGKICTGQFLCRVKLTIVEWPQNCFQGN